jgi:hypothetical protein
MAIGWRLKLEELLQPSLSISRIQKICTPNDVSEMGLRVVDGRSQLVGVKPISALYDKVLWNSVCGNRLLSQEAILESGQPFRMSFDAQAVRLTVAYFLVFATLATTASLREGCPRANTAK